MTAGINLRHTVSIAGVVRNVLLNGDPAPESPEEQRNLELRRRIAGALVEIMVEDAPAVFQTMVNAKQANPLWAQQRQRIDRTWSHSDGIFYFLDLPAGEAGEGYRLRITMPHMGTRFSMVETPMVIVPKRPAGAPRPPVRVDVELPSTRIRGAVTQRIVHDDGTVETQPVVGARIHLFGDSTYVRTRAGGHYELDRLLAGKPMIEILVTGFEPITHRVELLPGQVITANVQINRSDGAWQLTVA
jgi:hypothetical protein